MWTENNSGKSSEKTDTTMLHCVNTSDNIGDMTRATPQTKTQTGRSEMRPTHTDDLTTWASKKRDEQLARDKKFNEEQLDASGAIHLPKDTYEVLELPCGEFAMYSESLNQSWVVKDSHASWEAERGNRVATRPATAEEKQLIIAELAEFQDVFVTEIN